MKGALEMGRLSLKRLNREVSKEGSFTWDSERYAKKGSGYGRPSI
jgi:hypothetical protein